MGEAGVAVVVATGFGCAVRGTTTVDEPLMENLISKPFDLLSLNQSSTVEIVVRRSMTKSSVCGRRGSFLYPKDHDVMTSRTITMCPPASEIHNLIPSSAGATGHRLEAEPLHARVPALRAWGASAALVVVPAWAEACSCSSFWRTTRVVGWELRPSVVRDVVELEERICG